MSHLSINLHVASLGMHRNPVNSQSAARRTIGKLQSNIQRSSNAFVSLVQECLVDVMKPFQVVLTLNSQLCIRHNVVRQWSCFPV